MLKKYQKTKVRKNNLQDLIILNKKEGETPLYALESFRLKNKKYQDVSMTYAGRLDPMASGLLLILAGDKIKEKAKYLSLDKEYEFQVLFGFATDTYDILGKVLHSHILPNVRMSDRRVLEQKIKKNLKDFRGHFVQEYPIYSSKTVEGKPLFQYGREGKDVKLPKREVHVQSLKFVNLRKINREKLLQNIEKRIKKVKGDFRQKEILSIWKKQLKKQRKKEKEQFCIGSFKVKCSSGTYVRSISHSLGEKMGIPSLAYSIKRTKIGKYKSFLQI